MNVMKTVSFYFTTIGFLANNLLLLNAKNVFN